MEYLLKAAAIVTLFLLCYKLFLQKETYFLKNRFYFLAGILCAIILPLLIIPIYIEQTEQLIEAQPVFTTATVNKETTTYWTLTNMLSAIYFIGATVLSAKLIINLISLFTVIKGQKIRRSEKYTLIETNKEVSPFSFFHWIVYNPEMFSSSELSHILTHEKAHAKQWHSLDILLVQFSCILLWFNPFVWLYKKEVEQNLEFLADNRASSQASCSKSYQRLLLKTSIPNTQLVFANNFYNSLIKKRIVMLHKNPSNKAHQWKLLLVIPLLATFMFTFNTEVVAQNKKKVKNIEKEVVSFVITQKIKDAGLKDLKKDLKEHGVSLTIKNINRDNGVITSIKLEAKTKKSNANYAIEDDEGISPIAITYNKSDGSLSIGNTGEYHFGSSDAVWATGKNKRVKVISKDGDNEDVIIEIDGDEGHDMVFISDDGKKHKMKKRVKVIELDDDDEDIIEIKGDSDENVYIIKKEIETDGDDEKEVKVIIKSADGENKWIGEKVITVKDIEGNPLIYINGKEATKEAMEALDPNNIDKVEVLKGDKATEKYGKKAKDGVILITTK